MSSNHNIRLNNIVVENSVLNITSGKVLITNTSNDSLVSNGGITSERLYSKNLNLTNPPLNNSNFMSISNENPDFTNSIINMVCKNGNSDSSFINSVFTDSIGDSFPRFVIKGDGSSIWNGSISTLDLTDSSSSITGSIITSGGIGIAKKLSVGQTLTIESGNLKINSYDRVIESLTSGLTGGQTKSILLGKNISTNNSGYMKYTHSSDGSLVNNLTLGFIKSGTDTDFIKIEANGSLSVLSDINSSGLGSGALIVSGGLSVSGDIFYSGSIQSVSDIRVKKITGHLEGCLEKIMKLSCIKYERKDIVNPKPEIGLVAQEVKQVFPELVTIDEKGFNYMDYSRMTAAIISSIQELKKQLDDIKRK